MGRGQRMGVAHQHHPDAVGQEEPLVRIEYHRIGALDATEEPPALLGQQEEPAIRAVHVIPAPLPRGDVGDRVQGIHRAHVGRAGGGDDEPGTQPGSAVGRDGLGQRVGTHPIARVHGDSPHRGLREPGDPERLLDAMVRLVGEVND